MQTDSVTTPQIDQRLAQIDDCLYRLAVRALIIQNGKILLLKEKDNGWWAFPGGGLDYGEDILEALTRELAEELGISAADIKSDHQLVHVAAGAVVHGIPRANLFYRVEIPMGEAHLTNDTLEFGWFAPVEIDREVIARHAGDSASDTARLAQVIEAQINNR